MKNQFNTPEWQRRFRNLTTDIKQQKTVLLLGPEIVNIKGVTVQQTLRDQLTQTNAEDIAHYYKRDSILQPIFKKNNKIYYANTLSGFCQQRKNLFKHFAR